MRKYKNLILIICTVFSFFSCTKENDSPKPEETLLGQPVPMIETTEDYQVGAIYKTINWSKTYTEIPVLGKYVNNDLNIYKEHLKQANTAGIDYFLHDFRSSANFVQQNQDITRITNFDAVAETFPLDSIIKFAVHYNPQNVRANNVANSIDNDYNEDTGTIGAKETVFQQDFINMVPLFRKANYMKVDGKPLVYILNSHILFAKDNAAVYQRMRAKIKTDFDIDLYIIGVQQQWQPPLRYDFRFVGGVDALTHKNYMELNRNNFDRVHFFPRATQLAWTYSKDVLAKPEFNLEYIPTISPSINPLINRPSSLNVVFKKDEAFFRKICNGAKAASGVNRLIIVDSFNGWLQGTQIEAGVKATETDPESYGDQYLKILKEEFKVSE